MLVWQKAEGRRQIEADGPRFVGDGVMADNNMRGKKPR